MEIYLDIALRGSWLVLFVRIKLAHCGYQRVKFFATWAIDDFFLKIINGEKIKHLLMVIEFRDPPEPLTEDEVLQQVNNLEGIVLSKDPSKKTKISHSERGDNWLKKSIFFVYLISTHFCCVII